MHPCKILELGGVNGPKGGVGFDTNRGCQMKAAPEIDALSTNSQRMHRDHLRSDESYVADAKAGGRTSPI